MVCILDRKDLTLHLAARGEGKHLTTECGIKVTTRCTVGPYPHLVAEAARLCSECYLGRPS